MSCERYAGSRRDDGHIEMNRLAEDTTLVTCIPDFFGSYLGWDTDRLDRGFSC